MQKEDFNTVITLRSGKKYEGPKLPISEDILARNEPTMEKNVRNEKEYEKYEEVIVSKDKKKCFQSFAFPFSYAETQSGG